MSSRSAADGGEAEESPAASPEDTPGDDADTAAPELNEPLSALLNRIVRKAGAGQMRLADMIDMAGTRALHALLFLFGLINVLPSPPGTSIVTGMPMIILSTQMMLGHRLWLPVGLAARSVSRDHVARIVARTGPSLMRAEQLLHPRLKALVSPPSERALGALCLLLSLVLALPIPLGNLPPAFAICIISLALIGRDGLWVIAGLAISVLALVLTSGLVYAFLRAALFILSNAFA